MVTYVPDNTGRFEKRPFYKQEELDRECEKIIHGFLKEIYGTVSYPIKTDDLVKLIERDAKCLDVYEDLSSYGKDVEGVTEFRKGEKPKVSIAAELSTDERRQNRYRTTLTHEYGHVHFHSYLWEMDLLSKESLNHQQDSNKIICKRESILDAHQTDWMEWQAGYVCGAILMPKSAVLHTYREYIEAEKLSGAVPIPSAFTSAIIIKIAERFEVSEDAAFIRLLKLGLISDIRPMSS